MAFKVGDRVKILGGDTYVNGLWFPSAMQERVGQVDYIKDTVVRYGMMSYTLEGDCFWLWAESWLQISMDNVVCATDLI